MKFLFNFQRVDARMSEGGEVIWGLRMNSETETDLDTGRPLTVV